MNLEHMIETAQTAERGKFDMLFISDGNGVQDMEHTALFEANCLTSKPAVFEPTTVLSALATHTKNIGLLATRRYENTMVSPTARSGNTTVSRVWSE